MLPLLEEVSLVRSEEQESTQSSESPPPSTLRPLGPPRRRRGHVVGGGARARNNPSYHLYPGETLDGPRRILVENKHFTEGQLNC